jgi:polyhydroxyalkanoate synthesis regulator phasin
MAGLGDIVQKAFYLGVGIADYAAEKARNTLQELKTQAQQLADEMVARGEMTAEEARKFVNDTIEQAQQPASESTKSTSDSKEPRRIEIVIDEEETKEADKEKDNLENLRNQVQSLQDELRKLKRDG